MLSLIADFQIVKQIVAHLVGAARDGLKQSAASYDEIQGMDVEVLLLQEVRDNFFTEILFRIFKWDLSSPANYEFIKTLSKTVS